MHTSLYCIKNGASFSCLYRHNGDDCVLADERDVFGVMPREQRAEGGLDLSAQPDEWGPLQSQHQPRRHQADQELLRVSLTSIGFFLGGRGGVCHWIIHWVGRGAGISLLSMYPLE